MATLCEVLLTTEVSGQLCNVCAWDPDSGTQLVTYKGGSSTPQTLCLLQQDYIISAVCNKPLLHVWSIQRKDQVEQRMVCPGQVSALTASPDGLYCIAGIAEKIHIWQVASGNLLAVLSRHYQTISSLVFTHDGSHFISAAADNLILVWSLASVLSGSTSDSTEPRYVWSKHSLPITDLHVGCGGVLARVWSASLDHTVRMWDIASGQCLASFIFDHPITSVTTDPAEMHLFAGASNGTIYQVNLFQQPAKTERHVSSDDINSPIFSGHSKQVTCLTVSMDGSKLVSGSKDSMVKLWHIPSRQCTKTLPHKGPITNIKLILPPRRMLHHDTSAKHLPLPIKQFKRFLHGSQSQEHGEKQTRETLTIRTTQLPFRGHDEKIYENCLDCLENQNDSERQDSKLVQKELHDKVEHLQQVNKDIYQFTVDQILKGPKDDT